MRGLRELRSVFVPVIEDGELDSLHFDHSVYGLEEVNFRMLRRWQENFPKASNKWMATALLSIGRMDMIDTLIQCQ